ncbi:hypothetical protein D3C71_801750 [compost metagenome]
MDNKKTSEFLNDIILGKFLVNFIPGLIIFYVLTVFIDVKTGDGLISFLIVTTVSWMLGVLLELVFFRKIFYRRWQGEVSTSIDKINLLIGKTGVSIIIACVFCIDLDPILNTYNGWNNNIVKFIITFIKLLIFCIGGILLYRHYIKQVKKNKHRGE